MRRMSVCSSVGRWPGRIGELAEYANKPVERFDKDRRELLLPSVEFGDHAPEGRLHRAATFRSAVLPTTLGEQRAELVENGKKAVDQIGRIWKCGLRLDYRRSTVGAGVPEVFRLDFPQCKKR